MNRTLPLFEELPPPAIGQGVGRPVAEPQGERVKRTQDSAERHLKAAWRLSRAMTKFPDRSPEQTRAGLAICHHLQALLAAADQSHQE